jgi:cytochrome b
MEGAMMVYAAFAGLLILVVLGVVVASGVSAAIDAIRRALGKEKSGGRADP